MVRRGVLADVQAVTDLAVAATLGDEPEDDELPLGEPGDAGDRLIVRLLAER